MNVYIQSVGFAAVILAVLIYQARTRAGMLNLRTAASFVYGIHFGLLGAWTGMAMNFTAVVRTYVFRKRTEAAWANHKYWLWIFFCLAVVLGVYVWEGWYSILPLAGILIGTVSYWMKNPKDIRWIGLFPPLLWFVYAYIVGSYAGMVMEALMFTSVCVGIFRYDHTWQFFAHK